MKACPKCNSTELVQKAYFIRQVNEPDSEFEFFKLAEVFCDADDCNWAGQPRELLDVPNADDCDFVTLEGDFEDCPRNLKCNGCELYQERS